MSSLETMRGFVDRSGNAWSILASGEMLAEILAALDAGSCRDPFPARCTRVYILTTRSAVGH